MGIDARDMGMGVTGAGRLLLTHVTSQICPC